MALFGNLIREPLKAVAIVIWALWLDWRITLAMLLAGPIAMLIFWRVGESVRKANKKLLRGYGLMIGALSATLQTANVVKAYTAENAERRRFFRIDRKMLAQQKKLVRLDASLSPVLEVLATVAVCGLIIWLGGHVIGGSLDRSRFIALVITLAMMFDPLRKIADVYTRVQRSAAGSARLFDIFDIPEESGGTDSHLELPPLREQIEFRNVSFAYPLAAPLPGSSGNGTPRPVASGLVPGAPNDVASGFIPGAPRGTGEATLASTAAPKWALERVNLTIRKGETVAVVGPNGSGKTTLVGMLLRFYDPDQGALLFDGVDIRRVNLRSLRRQFALVTQEAVIFADSIAANIAYGKRGARRAEIEEAARRAYAADFIRLLPQEFATVVGERGSTLSGGERQRLAIARAILREAPILIFDEATSQVDSESEQKIQIALKEFAARRTTFIVAHRLSTIKFANRIIVMDAGRIVDSGTHEELLTRCPFYHGLCETQLVG
jgi:ABC-type multidrug transport system fused ATPase/permease subunit